MANCVHLGSDVLLRCLSALSSVAWWDLMLARSLLESMVMVAQIEGVIRDVAWSDSVSCVEVNIGLRLWVYCLISVTSLFKVDVPSSS